MWILAISVVTYQYQATTQDRYEKFYVIRLIREFAGPTIFDGIKQ